MFKAILARLQQKHQTMRYPDAAPPPLPDHFRGRPVLDTTRCPPGCRLCYDICPTNALDPQVPGRVDLGRCLFCPECANVCPVGAISYARNHQLAARSRADLLVDNATPREAVMRAALDNQLRKLFGRSLKLRQVSAGGCNACEADSNVLGTIGWDMGRFGIQFVASPRHADGLLVTGPVTHNMALALKKSYDALSEPRIVIAVGACAIAGGPYIDLPETNNGAASTVPINLYIPGCPPHPLTILDGLLRLIGRLADPAT